jgi:hypothetical protein
MLVIASEGEAIQGGLRKIRHYFVAIARDDGRKRPLASQ